MNSILALFNLATVGIKSATLGTFIDRCGPIIGTKTPTGIGFEKSSKRARTVAWECAGRKIISGDISSPFRSSSDRDCALAAVR
jgi:hypothetical protein